MRKDVKIIMAVCVIVLVGLIVYALFLPGEKKSPIAPTPDNNTAEVPATQPAGSGLVSAEPATQPSEMPIALSPPTAPTGTAMSNAGAQAVSTSSDWNKLLETGSSTPDAASPVTSSAMSAPITSPNVAMSAAPTLESTAAPAAPAISATGQRTYTVKAGDTPSSIAQAEYGNRQLYTKILAANPKLSARHMRVGQKIVLPDLSAASSGTHAETNMTAGSSVDTAGSSAAIASPSESAAGPRYTVVAGDSLERISTKLYGSSAQWEKIYDLNKSKIGSSPARLRVGMVLVLPKAPTAATPAVAR